MIEGCSPQHIDEILGLEEKGLRSSVVGALGYRDSENDYMANEKSKNSVGKNGNAYPLN